MCEDKTKEKSHYFRVLQDMEFELCWRDSGKLWKGIKQGSDMLPFMSRKFTLKTGEWIQEGDYFIFQFRVYFN